MKLYCIKVYELDRFNLHSETFWSHSKSITNLFLERLITSTNPKYRTFDCSKYSIEYFETEDDELVESLIAKPEQRIHIYSNHEVTRNIVVTAEQYKSAINGGSVLKNPEDVVMEKIHSSSVKLTMLLLRYSKNTDFLDYIYRLVKHEFSDIKIDNVEYILSTKPYLRKYEV